MDRHGRAALLSLSAHKMVVSPVKIVHVQAAVAPAIPGRLGIPASISFGDSTILVASLPAMVVEEIAGVARLASMCASRCAHQPSGGATTHSNGNGAPTHNARGDMLWTLQN